MIQRPVFLVTLFLLLIPCAYSQTLRQALATKDTVQALQLIGSGADIDTVDAYGSTPLMSVCHFPDLPMARFMLNHGASVNKRSPKGRTPLMVACAYWCGMDIIRLLVDKGSDVNAVSNDGTSALMLAAQNEKLDVVEYLLQKGAKADHKNALGKTAYDFAASGKVEEYMINSVKDTRFDREKVMDILQKAMHP